MVIDHVRIGRPGVILRVERQGVLGSGAVSAVICENDDARGYASDLALMLGFGGFVLRSPQAEAWIPAVRNQRA
ncbi:MAG: hypothetical protein ACM32E_05645 [Gemmatimonadota bacterium]